jgi:hypothetical protein
MCKVLCRRGSGRRSFPEIALPAVSAAAKPPLTRREKEFLRGEPLKLPNFAHALTRKACKLDKPIGFEYTARHIPYSTSDI